MRILSEVNVKNLVCLTRVDFNCPLDSEKNILDDTRIRTHAETVRYIASRQGKTVVIAHQGRPSSPDFGSLEGHAKILQEVLGDNHRVDFIPYTHGSEVETSIAAMDEGDILVLENVRMVPNETKNKSPEDHAKDPYIESLCRIGDIFVNDAFSAAHRNHMSLVGFPPKMRSCAGLIMEREIKNLQRVIESPDKPCVFVMGGIKPEDSFKVAEYVLSRDIADYVLTGGCISLILLKALKYLLGETNEEFLRQAGLLTFVDIAQRLINLFPNRIKTQIDFACMVDGKRNFKLDDLPLPYPILDIGDKTIEEYSTLVENASTVVYNGPMGKIEEKGFEIGTLEILRAMGRTTGFTLAGGGHSVAIIEKHSIKNLSYVSTSGGAMLRFLMGKELPAIAVLKAYS
ncbi:MAG: phosphoglycerate kinase [Candidatus Heimdallarchaeota archaeon]